MKAILFGRINPAPIVFFLSPFWIGLDDVLILVCMIERSSEGDGFIVLTLTWNIKYIIEKLIVRS